MDEDTLITTCDKLIQTLEQIPNLALRDVLQAQAQLAKDYAGWSLEYEERHEYDNMTQTGQAAYVIIEAVQVGLKAAGPFGISHGFSTN
jgi:hypothetical protein